MLSKVNVIKLTDIIKVNTNTNNININNNNENGYKYELVYQNK